MKSEHPTLSLIPALRGLWKEAFGDTDAFLDDFFRTGFSADRCLCITQNGRVAAALYWFDCRYGSHKLAYLYGVATAKAFRRQGFCRTLMEDTHALLEAEGYSGVLLVPGTSSLAAVYTPMGYRYCTQIREFFCTAAPEPVSLRPVDTAEYARLRRELLPEDSALQEGPSLEFLHTQARLYAGAHLLLAARREGDTLFVPELLGDPETAPGILCALGCARGRFRTPGVGRPFAMFRPLQQMDAPAYLGFAFD